MHRISGSRPGPSTSATRALPTWAAGSSLLNRAHALAAEAHGEQRRATDRAPFIAHVIEVGELLHEAGCAESLVAAGLLHDAVERGSLTEARLRAEMADEISALVLALTEDAQIASFAERKGALRAQVEAAGVHAITIFAADKLSDIRGLRRGIETDRGSIERRMGTSVGAMAAHYHESVAMIEKSDLDSGWLAALEAELEELASMAPSATPASTHGRQPAR